MLDNLESLARSFINNKNRELVLLENCYGSTTTNNIFYYPDFIAIDFETANRNRNSACSLALIVVEENQIVNKKHWYINPPTDDFYFSYLHGITKSTVLNAPTLAELWETELKFYIENKIIVAHNASFDISVLQTSLSEAGITQSKIQYLDTVEYARNFFPTLENHKLPTVCKFLGISLNHHNALSDAEACAQIVIKLNSQEYTTNSSENLAKIYQTTEEGTHLYKKIKDEIEFSHSTNIKDYYYFLYILQKCLVDTEKTVTDSFAAKIFRSTGDIYLKCYDYAGAFFFYSLANNIYDRAGVKKVLQNLEKEHPDKYQEVEKMVATNTFAENLFVNQTPSKELKGAVAKNGCFGCALPALSILFLLLILII